MMRYAVHKEPVDFRGGDELEKCVDCRQPTRFWLPDQHTPLCEACCAKRNQVSVLSALADQLKRMSASSTAPDRRSSPHGDKYPYIWWSSFRNDWWLSTSSGSRAVGSFEQAAVALAAELSKADKLELVPAPPEVELKVALDESVFLQSHYAKLLNMHDGGLRIGFKDGAAWIARLRETGKLPPLYEDKADSTPN